jgi:ubiquinone/menaquinone biosynthesis C-methylase UbiE
MAAKDIFGRSDQLDHDSLEAIITRLEARRKHPVFASMLNDYLARLPLNDFENVLDLGCGTGVAARALAKRVDFNGRVVGLDLSPAFIAAARRFAEEEGLAERVTFRVGNCHALPEFSGPFDAVILHTLISHVDDPDTTLAQAVGATAPGGWVVIYDGDYASLTFGTHDPDQGRAWDEAIIAGLVANPRIMRAMPFLLRRAGLKVEAMLPYVLTEVGTANFWESGIHCYSVLAPQAGTMSEGEAEAFKSYQLKSSADGTFFGSCNYYSYIAQRPA